MPAETPWAPQYAIRTLDTGTWVYQASDGIKTEPFLTIPGATPSGTEEYLSVGGRYGYAIENAGTEVRAFDLAARTYLGATALPTGHLGWSPLAVSPNGEWALCTTYDYPAVEPPAAQAWIEVFSIAAGALTHVSSIPIQHPSNVYGTGDIVFASDGTAYLASSRMGDATITPGYYVCAPPYSSASLTSLASLFVDPLDVALYGIALSGTGQVLVSYALPASSGVAIAGVGLRDLGLVAGGGAAIAVTPDGAYACVPNSGGFDFVASSGGTFAPTSPVTSLTLAGSLIHRVFALRDGSAFVANTYPFTYALDPARSRIAWTVAGSALTAYATLAV